MKRAHAIWLWFILVLALGTFVFGVLQFAGHPSTAASGDSQTNAVSTNSQEK